jgi:multiple sugar transport system permease protein/raffinose/stachyose/melibiose transport system permease protein
MTNLPGDRLAGGAVASRRGAVSWAVAVRRSAGRAGTPLLLLLPALAILVGLRLLPIISAIRLSFTHWDGLSAPSGVGLHNFGELLHDQRFKSALLHNLEILLAMPVWILLPYGIAWRLHTGMPGWRFFRLAFFIPVVLSPAVIGVYYGLVLQSDGPFNELLRTIGLGGAARAWLNDPATALPMVIAIIVWSSFGVGVLIFLSGLANLDQEQVDAARIDGATGWQVQRHVIFWQLLPVIEFWAIIVMIASFTAFFPLIYALTGGGPGFATYTVDFDLYQEAFTGGQLGYASAIGVVLLIIMVIIGVLTLGVLRRRRA